MIFLTNWPPLDATDAPLSPLNAVWLGTPPQPMTLPCLGHLFIVCPLGETAVTCSGIVVNSQQYLLLQTTADKLYTLNVLRPNNTSPKLLLLLLSPDFITEMAEFLTIPTDITHLLHAIPLPQGDTISHLLQLITTTTHHHEHTEELFLEVVGQILRLLQMRHHTILNLSHHKPNTVKNLIPCLLQARQFLEAHYLEPLQTQDIAQHILLSEYHFARLFRIAFGVTVHQYILQLRLNKARHLLESSNLTITDIAMTVGYNSLSAFIHAFHRYTHTTPSYYRRQFHL